MIKKGGSLRISRETAKYQSFVTFERLIIWERVTLQINSIYYCMYYM